MGLLYRAFTLDTHSVNDVTGTGRSSNYGFDNFYTPQPGLDSVALAPSGTNPSSLSPTVITPTDSGIILGTGTTAVTPTDDSIETLIDNGTATGELEYLGGTISNYTKNAGSGFSTFDIERIFRNASGGSITVNEIALYCKGNFYTYCIIRDKLSSGVAVADTEYLKVKYTIKITV